MPDIENMEKELIRLAVEMALLRMGPPELDKVTSMLKSNYSLDIEDCLTYPETLKQVLCELYGNCYSEIYESIIVTLNTETEDKAIKKFITVLRE